MPYTYAFDHKHRRPPMELKDLLGGKGANLAEMTAVLGLPVPPGFTIATVACRDYLASGWPEGLDGEIARQVRQGAGRADGRRTLRLRLVPTVCVHVRADRPRCRRRPLR
jgi:phosphoenolpyruvate synthase/pyruvate phosphate dikinase